MLPDHRLRRRAWARKERKRKRGREKKNNEGQTHSERSGGEKKRKAQRPPKRRAEVTARSTEPSDQREVQVKVTQLLCDLIFILNGEKVQLESGKLTIGLIGPA